MPNLNSIKNLSPSEAVEFLTEIIKENPDNEEAWALRAQNFWKLNRRREAINDCLVAVKINPASRAKTLLDFANSILDYYNKDLLNP